MHRIIVMVTLVVAGEIVFGLPFHTARFFRPTLLEVFGFSNTQLGDLFAMYGLLAMLSYFPGGALADRYPARTLLTASLVATAAGGFFMALIPGAMAMAALYAYWGITSIFLFWGALIRATREWGGDSAQGTAFGVLEAGRGIVAASIAGLAVALLASLMPDDPTLATDAERRAAFREVILMYSVATLAAAALTWFIIPVAPESRRMHGHPLSGMAIVIRRPIVWAQAAVVVCAYCGYKGLDNYSLYAVQVLGMNEVDAARLATWGAYSRPVAALAAGIIADRFDATRSIGLLFATMLVAYGFLATAIPDGAGLNIIYANLLVTFVCVYALRAVYFALLQENGTPPPLTGAAVGLMSLVGFSPEIFFGPITGRILDANPGLVGHQHYFLFLASIAALGIAVVAGLLWLKLRRGAMLWPEQEPAIVEAPLK